MMKIKTQDLIDRALAWAVAKVLGLPIYSMENNWPGNAAVNQEAQTHDVVIINLLGELWVEGPGKGSQPWSPQTDWAQGGPILQHNGIRLHRSAVTKGEIWWAGMASQQLLPLSGSTMLEAGMRCYVHSVIGDEVEIPEELC